LSKAKDRAAGEATAFSSSSSIPVLPVLPELPVLPVLPAGWQASACPRNQGRADARPSRGCGPGVLFGAQCAASRDGFALPVLARFCRCCHLPAFLLSWFKYQSQRPHREWARAKHSAPSAKSVA